MRPVSRRTANTSRAGVPDPYGARARHRTVPVSARLDAQLRSRVAFDSQRTFHHRSVAVRATSSEVQVYELSKGQQGAPVLFFIPGMDCTGAAMTPHVPQLSGHGMAVQALHIPPSNRESWSSLARSTLPLLRSAVNDAAGSPVIIVAESFGACLALRLAYLAPELMSKMVLINSATAFNSSLAGLPALIADTGLLGMFNAPLYKVAQGIMLPLLVDSRQVDPQAASTLRTMFRMEPPVDTSRSRGAASQQAELMELLFPGGFGDFEPAACTSHRMQMLRSGILPDATLSAISTPTLIVASAQDRLFPSMREGVRLQKAMSNAQRTILPSSGHAPLLERSFDLLSLLANTGVLPKEPYTTPVPSSEPSTAPVEGSNGTPPPPPPPPPSPPGGGPEPGQLVEASIGNGNGSSAAASNGASSSTGNGNAAGSGAHTPLAVSQRAPSEALPTSGTSGAADGSVARVPDAGESASAAQPHAPPLSGGAINSSGNGAVAQAVAPVVSTGAPVTPGCEDDGAAASPAAPPPVPKGTAELADVDSSRSVSARTATASQRKAVFDTEAEAEAPAGVPVATLTAPTPPASPAALGVLPPFLNLGLIDENFEDGYHDFRLWKEVISPVLLGLEKLPPPPGSVGGAGGRPMLFIGNHTQFGMYDLPLLFTEMYARGYQLTGLAHADHWKTPMGPFFERFGAVKASALSAHRALKKGKNVLLFPGGGREVVKRRGEQYQLFWPKANDFARLAASTNAIIVPFAAVGADDAFEFHMDTSEVLADPILGPLSRSMARSVIGPDVNMDDTIFPITRLPGSSLPSPFPVSNFGRVYFKFATPVDLKEVSPKDRTKCQKVYEATKATVEDTIQELLEYREEDPESGVWARAQRSASTMWDLSRQPL